MSSGKTSTTAYIVISGLVKLAAFPRWRRYFPDESVRLNKVFMQSVQDSFMKWLIARLPPRFFIFLMNALFIPGMTEHYLFRKRLIEDQLAKSLSAGTNQVIVLGAGLDTLALRMAKAYPNVRFYEIDLPDTQRAKKNALARIAYAVPPNCRFVEADLSRMTLESALTGIDGFDASAPTLVIIEGVLMYLTEPDVKALFLGMHNRFRGNLTVVFGANAKSDREGNWRLRMVDTILGRGRESTHWHCDGAAMPAFMAACGYAVAAAVTYKQLQRPYRENAEISMLPEEDENYYIVAKIARA